jgi:type I restriction enzyme, S subunit
MSTIPIVTGDVFTAKQDAAAPVGFKRTGAGIIPQDWDARTIRDVGTVKGGKRLPAAFTLMEVPTPHPYIRVSDMKPGGVATQDIRFVPPLAYPLIKNYRIFSDEVFISVAGTLGIVGVVPPELNGANLTENADKITDLRCHRDYLLYWLGSGPIQQMIDSIKTVGAQPKLALGRIAAFPIALPHKFEEQRAIAAALSDADELVGALDNLIAKTRAIKLAAMQQLLTGKTRLPGFAGDWTLLNMAENSVLKARIGWQGLTTAEYLTSGEYRLVAGTDFDAGRVDWSRCVFVDESRYAQDPYIQLRRGDVLLTKDGTIGKVGYIDMLAGPATLNSGVFVIRPKNGAYDPLFLYYVLTSSVFDAFLARLEAGSTIVHLYQKDFAGFKFMAPGLTEQRALAAALADTDAEIAALARRRDKVKAIKQGMMQALLTGRVRLVKPETSA